MKSPNPPKGEKRLDGRKTRKGIKIDITLESGWRFMFDTIYERVIGISPLGMTAFAVSFDQFEKGLKSL